jgi:hypothetical protein
MIKGTIGQGLRERIVAVLSDCKKNAVFVRGANKERAEDNVQVWIGAESIVTTPTPYVDGKSTEESKVYRRAFDLSYSVKGDPESESANDVRDQESELLREKLELFDSSPIENSKNGLVAEIGEVYIESISPTFEDGSAKSAFIATIIVNYTYYKT